MIYFKSFHSYFELNLKYNSLNEKYQELTSCHTCISKDPDENETPPAKRRKIAEDDENCLDPLKLPEPCANEIMSYLTGKELLVAMEVSKFWRDFIKVRSGLMDKLIFKPTIESCELPILNEVYDEDRKRHYKHLESTVNLYNKYYINISPITTFASTLETLVIKPHNRYIEDHMYCNQFCKIIKVNDPDLDVEPCDFPKLRMLTYTHHPYKLPFCLLKGSTFPVLTHLRIKSYETEVESNADSIDLREVKKFLTMFPYLEVLMLDVEEDSILTDQFINIIEPPVALDEDQPKIKALFSNEYFPVFTKQYQSSLEKLEISSAYETDIHNVLADLKALKSLSVTVTLQLDSDDEHKKFALNDSIEVLNIWRVSNEGDFEVQQRFRNILLALPSLKELTVYAGNFITAEIIKFIGNNLL